ncbi:IS630 transposase-related protein [Sabulilitoribacter arenilitoris]|uniref:IS630 transposase-related protein n=1 Tax=Wocania arenilitoris TaxID=2044858 RepID=A0AAE3JLL1_9FLAO|nr:IS630 transposase-related protein [Wocania arenilitoris]
MSCSIAYSLDFREQVFKVKQKEQLTFQELSDWFGIPIRTLFRWQQRIEPKTNRIKPSTKIDMEVLRKDIQNYPDRYQYERAKIFGVSQSAIFYALQRLNISYKKNAISS